MGCNSESALEAGTKTVEVSKSYTALPGLLLPLLSSCTRSVVNGGAEATTTGTTDVEEGREDANDGALVATEDLPKAR